MSTEPIKKLLQKWTLEKLAVERAIGQLIQHADMLWDELTGLGQKLVQLAKSQIEAKQERDYMQAEIDRLLKHNKLKPLDRKQPLKRKRGRPRKERDWLDEASVN